MDLQPNILELSLNIENADVLFLCFINAVDYFYL